MTEVTLQWVKAYVETAGNETADLLVKEATGTPCAGPEPFLPAPFCSCKRAVARWIDEGNFVSPCKYSQGTATLNHTTRKQASGILKPADDVTLAQRREITSLKNAPLSIGRGS